MSARAVLIYNPGAGGRRAVGRGVDRMLADLAARGVQATLRTTGEPGDATRFARDAVREGVSRVIVHGGDGTINEALQALVGSTTALGVWPAGTANVLARELGLPRERAALAEVLARGPIRRVSAGRAGDRYFMLMAGIGLDAAAVRRVNPTLKRVVGEGAYWMAGLRQLAHWHPARFVVEAGGERHRATFAVVANAPLYGGGLRFAPHARMDDDLLDLCLFDSDQRSRFARYLAAARTGSHLGLPGVIYLRARSAVAHGEGAPWVHVDGELLGRLPLRFECVPGAVSLIVPR